MSYHSLGRAMRNVLAGMVCIWRIYTSSRSVACLFRRGAAFGLAGIIKGLGVSALNQYGTMDTLRKALDDQANADAREGALFAFECMCEKLGRYAFPTPQAVHGDRAMTTVKMPAGRTAASLLDDLTTLAL